MRRLLPLVLAACIPPAIPPEPPGFIDIPTVAAPSDAGADDPDGKGTDLGEACAELRALGCPEGQPLRPDLTCYQHLLGLSAIVTVPAKCLRTAASQDAVRACGDDTTLRFRCRP
jgi:hypothetical protein